ncbi:hypothetical protein SUGI_0966230 [Cryptomeria japonica]|nr:hypothetical protein SUGI_0966230 [Cryptomeria japonica]
MARPPIRVCQLSQALKYLALRECSKLTLMVEGSKPYRDSNLGLKVQTLELNTFCSFVQRIGIKYGHTRSNSKLMKMQNGGSENSNQMRSNSLFQFDLHCKEERSALAIKSQVHPSKFGNSERQKLMRSEYGQLSRYYKQKQWI